MWQTDQRNQLYETIFTRKSVRKFESAPLSEEQQAQILALAEATYRPLPDEPVAFRILTPNQIKGIVSAKTPHYLAVYAKRSDAAIVNAAFALQQMDLWFSSQGLGSCWLGMPHPVRELGELDGLPYLILLAFGTPTEASQRAATSEFKRKPLAEISNVTGREALLEPLRLAPSSTNRQPWYLTGDSTQLHLHCKLGGLVAKKMLGDMPTIDIGIGLCHLWLACEQAGCFAGFAQQQGVTAPSGYRYLWTVKTNS